jgi:L,D-transpeptidase YbiS
MGILVSVKNQTLTFVRPRNPLIYPISTALKGVGQKEGSEQTPLGKHIIYAKIGGGSPERSVFVARRWTGEIYTPELAASEPDRDWVLSRILWLQGTELGKNRGGDCDSKRRYIYIHGTPYENEIGKPASRGCIRMRNRDVIALYDLVNPGTSVRIES